jgi:hypothetical protein
MKDGFELMLVGKKVGPWSAVEFYEAFDTLVTTGKGGIVPVILDDSVPPRLPFWRTLKPLDFKGTDFDGNMRRLILELKMRKAQPSV